MDKMFFYNSKKNKMRELREKSLIIFDKLKKSESITLQEIYLLQGYLYCCRMKGYKYLNLNPMSKEENDCVCRAISLATHLPYKTVDRLLQLTGIALKCDELCPCCYHYLLEDIFSFNCYKGDGKTVKEIASDFKDTICIIRISGHLTCSVFGIIYDIWDCSNEICDRFWIKQ